MSCRSCPTTKRNSLCSFQSSFSAITQNWQCWQIWHICVSVHISFHFIQLIRTSRSIFNKLTGDYNTFNKKHSSRMRTVRSSPYGRGGSFVRGLCQGDSWTETPRQRSPRQRPPRHRPYPWTETPPPRRNMGPGTETPTDGTWGQAVRQEVTSYRDPLPWVTKKIISGWQKWQLSCCL